jgi:hypothetical protein
LPAEARFDSIVNSKKSFRLQFQNTHRKRSGNRQQMSCGKFALVFPLKEPQNGLSGLSKNLFLFNVYNFDGEPDNLNRNPPKLLFAFSLSSYRNPSGLITEPVIIHQCLHQIFGSSNCITD